MNDASEPMTDHEADADRHDETSQAVAALPWWLKAYPVFANFGLLSVSAALIFGFRYDDTASFWNYPLDIFLYTAFLAPHLMLTRSDVKQSLWGQRAGTIEERQIYIAITIVTWLAVLALHRAVPGPALELPDWVRFIGLVGMLWSVLWFFNISTPETLRGMLGLPGSELQFTHGEETPLRSDGVYGLVRHPIYLAMLLIGGAGLIYHPNAGQLLWSLLLGGTLVAYIPVEESLLVAARGDEYLDYCRRVPYRLIPRVW